MVAVKRIDQATWDALPDADLTEGDHLRDTLQPGTYRHVRADLASETVPTLVAGAIDNVSPEIGDTLTFSGSNARAGAAILWEADLGGGYNPAGGTNNGLTYDTTGQQPGDYRMRITDGAQGPVYTAAVTVASGQPAAVDPEILNFVFTASGGGDFPAISFDVGYAGTRTLTAHVVTVDPGGLDPTDLQMIAGSGAGIIEKASAAVVAGTNNLDLTGFTNASDGADVHVLVAEDGTDPGISGIEIATSTGLDYSPATYQSGSTDAVDGSTWTLVFDEAIYDPLATVDPSHFAVTSTGDSPTISDVAVNGTVNVVLTLTGDLPENGDTLTVSYSGGDLVDVDGNPIANFGPVGVTNNVPAGGGSVAPTVAGPYSYDGAVSGTQNFTADLSGFSEGQEILLVYGAGNYLLGLTVNGNNAVDIGAGKITGAGGRATGFTYTIGAGEAVAGITVTAQLDGSDNDGGLVIVGVAGATLQQFDDVPQGAGDPIVYSLTPGAATNTLVSIASGQSGNFSGTPTTPPPTYSGDAMTEVANVNNQGGTAFGQAVAYALDAPISPAFSATLTGSGAGDRWTGFLTEWR